MLSETKIPLITIKNGHDDLRVCKKSFCLVSPKQIRYLAATPDVDDFVCKEHIAAVALNYRFQERLQFFVFSEDISIPAAEAEKQCLNITVRCRIELYLRIL